MRSKPKKKKKKKNRVSWNEWMACQLRSGGRSGTGRREGGGDARLTDLIDGELHHGCRLGGVWRVLSLSLFLLCSSPSGGRFFWRGAIKDGSPPDVRRELVAASAARSAFGIRKTGFLQGNRQEYACRKSGVPQHGISTRMGFTEIARLSVLSRNDLSQAVNNLAS